MNDTASMGQEPGWVQRNSSAMYYEASPHADRPSLADVQPRRTRKMVFGGPTPKNVRRHDCLGVLRPEGPQVVRHMFQRARRPPVPRFHKASSESSLLRSPSSGLALTDVYDDTVSCRSGDRLMTRTVALRRQANLAKAKRLDDLMKARMHSSGELPKLDRSRSPLPRPATPARSLGDRSPSRNLTTTKRTAQPPIKRDQKPSATSKPVARAVAKPATAQSQIIAPSESFRLFEPSGTPAKKLQHATHNRSMPNLLRQLRPSSYSDDSIDGSVADALNAASDDSLSEIDNRRQMSTSKSESGNLLRVEPSYKNRLPSASSMPQLAVTNMDLFQVQAIELTPPDSGRKQYSLTTDVLNSSKCRETQTDSSACDIHVQTERLLATRPAQMQTDNTCTSFSSVQTELSASKNLHVQTDIGGAIQQVRIVPVGQLRHGGVQTEPSTNAMTARTDRDVQTDVSCTGKSSRSKRELVLKGRDIPLNELNEASLQLKHGHREITESDYFMPPQNGQLSPSLSETSSLSERHSYMKSQALPLHFVSNRPNIFLRKPSRANGASNANDEFDFLTSTMIGDDHERNKDSKKDGNEQEGSLDSCDGSFSDGTVIDSSITDVDESAPDRTNLNGFRSPSPTIVASHKHMTSDSKNNLLARHDMTDTAVIVAHEASQTEVDYDSSSVTIILNARKPKPTVLSYAYYYCDPLTFSHDNEDGKSVSEASADTFSSSRTFTLERLRHRRWSPNSREYYASEYYKGAIFQLSSEQQNDSDQSAGAQTEALADNSLVTVNARTELLLNINDKLENDAAIEVKISTDGTQTMKMSSWNFSKNKPTVRSGSGEQSTEGVHPNAVQDPQNFCVVCGKRVYQLEKIAAHKGIYHKSCFRCEVCETTLRPGSFSVLEGHLFCKPHLIQQFKTRGKYETSAAFKAREASANGIHASTVQNENAAAD